MSIQPPKIDNRTYEDIVEQTVKLVQDYTASQESVDNKAEFLRDRTLAEDIKDTDGKIVATADTLIDEQLADKIAKVKDLKQVNVKVKGWLKPEKPDAGLALIRIFGRMAATVSDRLNRVPEKNFLAFLDLLGTQILPPQPARVPLTFYLASGVPENTTALVPAYTQISAPPAEGEEEEVVFEMESDLLVTSVQLQAVFVRDLKADRYSDRTLQATGKKDTAFLAFAGDTAIEHSLYLACEPIFSLSEAKTVTLNIGSANASTFNPRSLTWYYLKNSDWQELNPVITTETNPWEFAFNEPALPVQTFNQKSRKWLTAKLNSSFVGDRSSLTVESIKASINIANSQLKLDQCFFNSVPLDLSKDFYPFGEQPRFNDTFYFSSQAIFSKPGTTVTLHITISDKEINKNGGVEIAWEFYDSSIWQKLGKSSIENPAMESKQNVIDGTKAFSESEKVTFTIPETMKSVTVNGVNNYWLRARIVKGNYGTEATYRQRMKDGKPVYVNEVPIYELVPASFAPPSIQSISLEYSLTNIPLSDCLSYNNFTYQVHTTNFQPFVTATDKETRPTLYLGFDKPFPNRAIALYFQVEPPKPEEVALKPDEIAPKDNQNDSKPVRLIWEYSNGSGWNRLGVVDETKAFTEGGLIKFIGPSDFSKTQEFCKTLYWLRVCWESGEFRVQPRLRRILTNTIWASQTTTLQNEILGSSNGNPNQTFRTVQSPVLPGQQLEVQEQKIPPPEEQKEIEKLEGKEAITIVRDKKGEVETIWVRWHEVADFYESGRRDRHYIMNHLTGEIQFGDGQRGMIPPQGRNNIRMAQYRTDGGERGNKPANTITQLKTTIPYIDRVINLSAAGGGANRESIERVKERGPKFLRYRGRAVTVQDFEDLAYEASPDIARTRVITSIFDPLDFDEWIDRELQKKIIQHEKLTQKEEKFLQKKREFGINRQIDLLIVPNSNESQPVPSLALIDRVQTYIQARCLPMINLKVSGPDWIQISVTAELVPKSLEAITHIQEKATAKLDQFLHPLTGNRNQQGWDFGCEPDFSDFYALLQSIEGVKYVRNLQIKKSKQPSNEEKDLELFMIYSGKHLIEFSQID